MIYRDSVNWTTMRNLTAVFLCFVVANAELDVTLVRNLTGQWSSECHALSDSGSEALEWIGIPFFIEMVDGYIRMNDYHERTEADDLCRNYGMLCDGAYSIGFELGTNFKVDVPPFTDVRWESLHYTLVTDMSSKFTDNSFYITAPSLYFSIKGTGLVHIHFAKMADTYYGGYSLQLADDAMILLKCSSLADLKCLPETKVHHLTTELFNAQRWSHLFVRFQNNAIIVGRFAANGRETELGRWENQGDVQSITQFWFKSGGFFPFQWKLHASALMFMTNGTREGVIKGMAHAHDDSGRICLSFWYFMTPGSNANLTVNVDGVETVIKDQKETRPVWKRYVEEYSNIKGMFVTVVITGRIPPEAPKSAVIAVDNIRKCGPGKDISHSSIVPSLKPRCAPAFQQEPEDKGSHCKKECSGHGSCYQGRCECYPQSTGQDCGQKCSVDTFGKKCSGQLTSGRFDDRILFCNVFTGDCVCKSGFGGPYCTTRCDPGFSGANCTEVCANCAVRGQCDPENLNCIGGCIGNYRPPKCLYLPSYLDSPPVLTQAAGAYSFMIDIPLGQSNILGHGVPINYMVQYRLSGKPTWNSVGLLPLNQYNNQSSSSDDLRVPFRIGNLQPGSKYDVRVLLQDDDMDINTDVRHATFQTCTPNPNPPSPLKVVYQVGPDFSLEWPYPNGTAYCHIDRYEVTWSFEGAGNSSTASYPGNTAWVSGIPRNTTVQFKVRGVSADSATPFSEVLSYATNNYKCASGSYGVTCKEKCGRCVGGKTCDDVTGICDGGCEGNYRPPLCLLPPSYLLHQPTMRHNSSNSLMLAIQLGSDNFQGEGDPTHYQVQYRKTGDSEWRNASEMLSVPQANETTTVSYNITGLEEKASYDVRVILKDSDLAVNTNVNYTSLPTCQRTQQPPGKVVLTHSTSTSVTLRWKQPSDVTAGISCPITEYHVKYVSNGKEKVVKIANITATVGDLSPDTRLEVTVCSISEETNSVCAGKLTVSTTEEDGRQGSSVGIIIAVAAIALLIAVAAFWFFAIRNKWCRSMRKRPAPMNFSTLSPDSDDEHGGDT